MLRENLDADIVRRSTITVICYKITKITLLLSLNPEAFTRTNLERLELTL